MISMGETDQPRSNPLFNIIAGRDKLVPLFDSLASAMSPADILAVRLTCKAAEPICRELQRSSWNINMKLGRFVRDAKGLRSLLGENNALISGSFALQFFARVVWEESDLDIFVEDGSGVKNMQDYICNREGYTLASSKGRADLHEYHFGLIQEIHTYERQPGEPWTYRKVQIVVTDCIPFTAIVFGFYTTALVNIITWNKAYCIFPQPTFIERTTYPLVQLDEYYRTLHAKMDVRGWPLETGLWQEAEERVRVWNPWKRQSPEFLGGETCCRRVGDDQSWIIAFPTDGVKPPEMPDSVIEYSEFRITSYSATQDYPAYYHVNAPLFRSLLLRYTYMHCNILSHLGPWLIQESQNRLIRMKPDERPVGGGFEQNTWTESYMEYTFDWPDDYQVPEWWTYHDADIPEWYEYEEHEMRLKRAKEGRVQKVPDAISDSEEVESMDTSA